MVEHHQTLQTRQMKGERKMKKASVHLEIFVPDNFQPGDCEHCVFRDVHETEVSYQVYERKVECHLGSKSFTCPIHVHIPTQYEELGF